MKEFLKKARDLVTCWKENRWTWFYIGQYSFYLHGIVMICMTIFYCFFRLGTPNIAKDYLWLGELVGALFFALEFAADYHKYRMPRIVAVFHSKRFVAFGQKSDYSARVFLRANLMFNTLHTAITHGFFFCCNMSKVDYMGLILVNTTSFMLHILIRYGFSKFYAMTPEDERKLIIEDENRRRVGIGPWNENKWIWFDLGNYFLKLYLFWMLVFSLMLDYRLLMAITNNQKKYFYKNLFEIFMFLGMIIFALERDCVEIPSLSLRVIYKKRYVAFGPQYSFFARTFLVLNLLYAYSLSVLAIMSYRLNQIDAERLKAQLLSQLFLVIIHFMIRYSFSKFYYLNSQEEIDEVIEYVEGHSMLQGETDTEALLNNGDGAGKAGAEDMKNADVEFGAGAVGNGKNMKATISVAKGESLA